MPHLSSVVRFGDILFLSGQLGFDADNHLPTGIVAQTRQCLANIEKVLANEGVGLSHILKATVFLTDKEDYAAFDATYGEILGETLPARSTVIAGLAVDGARIEIEVVVRSTNGRIDPNVVTAKKLLGVPS